jgi:hypothetical protein
MEKTRSGFGLPPTTPPTGPWWPLEDLIGMKAAVAPVLDCSLDKGVYEENDQWDTLQEANVNGHQHFPSGCWRFVKFGWRLQTKTHVDINCGVTSTLVFQVHEWGALASRCSKAG